MLRTAAILVVTAFALPALAQDNAPRLPENSIDCNQFKKTGPNEWIEVGTAVFNLGSIKDINLTNQPVTPGYFKFGGIDVYPVLERKCGVSARETAAKEAETKPALAELAPQAADPKDSPAAAVQTPPDSGGTMPAPVGKIAENRQDIGCGDRKSVYAADGAKGAAVEIAFQNKNGGEERSNPDSEFAIREIKNNEPNWVYKGKYRQGRFVFALKPSRERGFMPATISVPRQDSKALAPAFIKPNRNGAGEPILYLSGLKTLFASKETIRRLKFEGNFLAGPMPEVFYFDRCE